MIAEVSDAEKGINDEKHAWDIYVCAAFDMKMYDDTVPTESTGNSIWKVSIFDFDPIVHMYVHTYYHTVGRRR